MQLSPPVKAIALEFRAGLLALLHAFLRLLVLSRLAEAFVYGLVALIVLAPFAGIGQLLNWALARDSAWFGLAVVAIAAIFLILWAAVIANEQFLREIRHQGIEWPSLLSVALAWFAIAVFGGLSCGFERIGIVEIQPAVPFAEGCATRYADMYLWHLFDSIPGIKFNETVGWTQEYSYSDKLSGWLLVAFKVLVIVSVIGSFVVCGRLRREASDAGDRSKQEASRAAKPST
jgi:hypothetical protein